ncbi:MAG: hypothetical protein WBW40_01945 [Thermoplasmata archaeon]
MALLIGMLVVIVRDEEVRLRSRTPEGSDPVRPSSSDLERDRTVPHS